MFLKTLVLTPFLFFFFFSKANRRTSLAVQLNNGGEHTRHHPAHKSIAKSARARSLLQPDRLPSECGHHKANVHCAGQLGPPASRRPERLAHRWLPVHPANEHAATAQVLELALVWSPRHRPVLFGQLEAHPGGALGFE